VLSIAEEEEDSMLHELFAQYACEHVYVDMGTNIGVQLRKLYEPEKYLNAQIHPVFEKFFGLGTRCNVCSIGFEPNPKHTHRLRELQQRYRYIGYGVLIYHAAAGTHTGTLKLSTSHESVSDSNDVDGTLLPASRHSARMNHTNSVRNMDVARVLRQVDTKLRQQNNGKRGRRKIVVKSDIEGSEYQVLLHLALHNVLCVVDFLYAEWHSFLFKPGSLEKLAISKGFERRRSGAREVGVLTRVIESNFMKTFAESSRTCSTQIAEMDDESFVFDGKPWPTEVKCRGEGAGP